MSTNTFLNPTPEAITPDSGSCISASPACSLCDAHHGHMRPVSSWKNTAACEFVSQKGITAQSLVCRPCRQDICRLLGDPSYIPRWEKNTTGITCCIADCMEGVLSSCNISDATHIQSSMQECGLQCKEDPIPVPTPLCTHHYHTLYKLIHPQPNGHCTTCETSLRHIKSRPCPNPSLIETHLWETTSFRGHISPTDRVCFSCYKSHLTIIQQEMKLSKDRDLKLLLDHIQQRINAVKEPSTLQHIENLAMDKTLAYIENELLQPRAVLLPAAHSNFLQHHEQLQLRANICCDPGAPKTAMWVFGNIICTLKHHLEYSCKIRKYGTLMYRPNTNFTPLL